MSSIESLTTATDASIPKAVGKSTLDRQDFMTLFQLAQFSNMEATMKMSDNMEKLLDYQKSQNNLQLLDLVGKEVQGFGNSMGVVEGVTTPTEYTLHDAADTCVIEVYDAAGRMVDTVDVGYAASGAHTLEWDATNARGEAVADGTYSYRVTAIDSQGQEIDVDYRTTGKVTGIEFNGGVATVSVDKYTSLSVGDILVVR